MFDIDNFDDNNDMQFETNIYRTALSIRHTEVVDICKNEYLFTVTGVKKMKWFLSLTRCHFQPRVTEGHECLEMAPSEK